MTTRYQPIAGALRPVKTATLLFALFLAACGGGGDDPPIDEATSTTQPLNSQDKPDVCR